MSKRKRKVSFVVACNAVPVGRFKRIPGGGRSEFKILTPEKHFNARAHIVNMKIVDLALTYRSEEIHLLRFYEAYLGSARWDLRHAQWQRLEDWLTLEDALDGILNSRLFVQDLQLIVETLEAEKKLKKIGL